MYTRQILKLKAKINVKILICNELECKNEFLSYDMSGYKNNLLIFKKIISLT